MNDCAFYMIGECGNAGCELRCCAYVCALSEDGRSMLAEYEMDVHGEPCRPERVRSKWRRRMIERMKGGVGEGSEI